MIDFSKKYNREEVINFLKTSFLKDYQKDIRRIQTQDGKFIKNAYSLGYSPELELAIFELEHEGSTEKRVSLTKEAFNILKNSGNFRALAFFHSSDTDDWRFSLMTATPTRNDKNKVKVILSNPKRYSFLLGPNAKVNTPTRFLITKGEVQDFDDLKERFSVEVVNKEFYKYISAYFISLAGSENVVLPDEILKLVQQLTNTKYLKKDKKGKHYEIKQLIVLPKKGDEKITQEFAVRLIGRLIFCWFLREKKNGSEEALMPHALLSLEESQKHKNYYHDVLEPIFFKVLNVKISNRREEKFRNSPFSKIPYLNGGLFSPHDDDFYSKNDSKQEKNNEEVVVPDKWLQKLFEILETYNFTIDENSAFDEELSIDPEMLGRIFENLLAEINPETGESARKSTGSYYTPRVIVEYMVDESLLLYLKNKTEIEEAKLRSLISYDLDDDTYTPLTEDEKEKIISAIDELKILDPACGSGAFPMGILQKIVFILQQLDLNGQYWFKAQLKGVAPELQKRLEKEHKEGNFDYIRKLGIIRKNIFGVDIQPIATEISRLRCFLTLIVDQKINDEEVNRGIDPLPNLDFKFVTANSLIPLPEKEIYGQTDWLQDESGIEDLKELREEFFNADVSEKDPLIGRFAIIQRDMAIRNSRDSVGDYTKYLTEWNPFSHNTTPWFDSEWMFGIKDGFNIVIGNPPYGFRNVLTKKEKEYFRKVEKINFSSGDIAELFCKKAFDKLVSKEGVLSFIIPKKSSYGDSWHGWRSDYLQRYNLRFVLDAGKAFDNVLLEQTSFGLVKSEQKGLIRLSYLDGKKNQIDLFANSVKTRIFKDNNTMQIYRAYYPEKLLNKIKDRMEKNYIVGGDLGLPIGTNFFSEAETKYKLLKGIDIKKWVIRSSRYLKNEDKLNWDKAHKFLRKKVIAQRLIAHIENPTPHIKITACFDDEGLIITNTLTTFILPEEVNEFFWLGYINSKFVNWYTYNFIYSRAIRSMDLYDFYIRQIPLAIATEIDKEYIIQKVKEILQRLSKSNDINKTLDPEVQELEEMIDKKIYELYGLTKEEIGIIEEGSILPQI